MPGAIKWKSRNVSNLRWINVAGISSSAVGYRWRGKESRNRLRTGGFSDTVLFIAGKRASHDSLESIPVPLLNNAAALGSESLQLRWACVSVCGCQDDYTFLRKTPPPHLPTLISYSAHLCWFVFLTEFIISKFVATLSMSALHLRVQMCVCNLCAHSNIAHLVRCLCWVCYTRQVFSKAFHTQSCKASCAPLSSLFGMPTSHGSLSWHSIIPPCVWPTHSLREMKVNKRMSVLLSHIKYASWCL